jgi:uncharacterized protein YoxC
MRTVTTPAAQDAVRQMQADLPGLKTTATDLIDKGNTLANPVNWDGPKATQFRTTIWPDVDQALRTLSQELTDLADSISQVNQRTTTAGS